MATTFSQLNPYRTNIQNGLVLGRKMGLGFEIGIEMQIEIEINQNRSLSVLAFLPVHNFIPIAS